MAQPPVPWKSRCAMVVMEHMEANQRYHFAACCPSIRQLHAQVPLRIETLGLRAHGFTVNDNEHTISTYVRNIEQVPRGWLGEISPNGLHHDIDDLGFRCDEPATEGDITINEVLMKWNDLVGPGAQNGWMPVPGVVTQRRMEVGRVRRQREKDERSGMSVTVEKYLMYTYRKRVRFPEGTEFAEALRNLTRNFFAPAEIFVNLMEIPDSFGILRLPRDLRFHVTSLCTMFCSAIIVTAISPIITTRLQKLEVEVRDQDDPIFNHEILRTLPCLAINISYDNIGRYGDWAAPLVRLEVPIVEIYQCDIPVPSLATIGDHWERFPRPLGHKMSFQFRYIGHAFTGLLRDLDAMRGTFPPGMLPREYPHCGFIQVTAETDFVFYVKKAELHDWDICWWLTFEVMNVGYARALEEERD